MRMLVVKSLIRAFLIGYEIAGRLGYASNMKDNMHPHGTWGIVGGVIACAILMNKSEEETLEAALVASSIPLATSWEAAVTGMTVRNLYTGIACEQASRLMDYQKAGFKSSMHVVDHLWSRIMTNGINYAHFIKDSSQPFLLDKNYFKLYSACLFTHPAIDATKILMKEKLDVSKIEIVEVETYSLAARLYDPNPSNYLQGKF